jgi:asparagine synthase (glutamine-hydrolysing)
MLPGLLMMAKGDRIAMNASVETRYPFLDEDVIEFCAGIDPRYKLRGLTDKWILRRVAASVLPKPIARRRKTMFRATRSGTFLGEHRPAWVDQLLSDESLRRSGWFDPEAVARARRLVARPLITPARSFFDLALTGVISTQLWHHLFCGGRLADLPTWSPPVPEQVEA